MTRLPPIRYIAGERPLQIYCMMTPISLSVTRLRIYMEVIE